MFGVFDGHGKNGADASNFVMGKIRKLFTKNSEIFSNHYAITEMFNSINLSLESAVNWNLSGTTAWIWTVNGSKLTWINLGDSRAVLFTQDEHNKWSATPLSRDHVLDIPEEKIRIEVNGGVIRQYLNSNGALFGPKRVWKSKQPTPGLAMSRSLGDTVAHSIGVIWTPGNLYCLNH